VAPDTCGSTILILFHVISTATENLSCLLGIGFFVVAIWTMHSHKMNNRPTNASKPNALVHSLLHVSALQSHHLQGFQYEPAELLPNVVKSNWEFRFHDIGQQFSRLILNSLKMVPLKRRNM
jgi:hypothetical protein